MLSSAAFAVRTPLPCGVSRRFHRVCVVSRSDTASDTSSSDGKSATPRRESRAVQIPYACVSCGAAARPLERASCDNCGAFFNIRDGFIDMVAPENLRRSSFQLQYRRQDIFRSPLVSFLYERGWRDAFRAAGFPGADIEYGMAERFFLSPDADGLLTQPQSEHESRTTNGRLSQTDARKIIVDLSCGSGLLTRRFAASHLFDRVIALDLSASMLREALSRATDPNVTFDAVRADASKLPFQTSSIQFAHAGAALHCWPKLQDALAEVHRILLPGGRLFATTFLKGAYIPLSASILSNDSQAGRFLASVLDDVRTRVDPFRYFNTEELRWLLKSAGFEKVDVEEHERCAIVRCVKKDD